jgi:hypothetical protein
MRNTSRSPSAFKPTETSGDVVFGTDGMTLTGKNNQFTGTNNGHKSSMSLRGQNI